MCVAIGTLRRKGMGHVILCRTQWCRCKFLFYLATDTQNFDDRAPGSSCGAEGEMAMAAPRCFPSRHSLCLTVVRGLFVVTASSKSLQSSVVFHTGVDPLAPRQGRRPEGRSRPVGQHYWHRPGNPHLSGPHCTAGKQTNNRAELLAVIAAMKILGGNLEIRSETGGTGKCSGEVFKSGGTGF